MYFLLFKKALFSAIRSISMNAIFSTIHQKQTDQRKSLWFPKCSSLLISLLQQLLLSLLCELYTCRQTFAYDGLSAQNTLLISFSWSRISFLLFRNTLKDFLTRVQAMAQCGSTTALLTPTAYPYQAEFLNSWDYGFYTPSMGLGWKGL